MKNKRNLIKLVTLAVVAATILVAGCSKKTSGVLETEQTTTVESTEDKFSLGDVTIAVPKETKARDPKETEVVETFETYADGTYSGKYANGETFITGNKPGDLAKKANESATATEEQTQGNQSAGATEATTLTTPAETLDTAELESIETKFTESEYVTYDNVVEYWVEEPTLSDDYVRGMITEKQFPSLTEKERQALINEILTAYPHDPAETVPYEY